MMGASIISSSRAAELYANGEGLVDRLVKEFPRFNDVSEFEGHEIKFLQARPSSASGACTRASLNGRISSGRHFENDGVR